MVMQMITAPGLDHGGDRRGIRRRPAGLEGLLIKGRPGRTDTSTGMTVPGLKAAIEADMFQALTSHDDVRLAALRTIMEAISAESLKRGVRSLDDDDVAAVVAREVRRCSEAISIYRSSRQNELARRELSRLSVLACYMPIQLTNEELRDIVAAVMDEVTISDRRDLDVVRCVVMDRIGARADFDRVTLAIEEVLGRTGGTASVLGF